MKTLVKVAALAIPALAVLACSDSPTSTRTATALLDAGGIGTTEIGGQVVATCFGQPATIVVAAPGLTTYGTPGADVIIGTSGNDVIYGDAGDDLICGDDGDDILIGHGDDDRIHGGPGNDLIEGSRGNDHVEGSGGDDWVEGNMGNDTVEGNVGIDRVSGGPGGDAVDGGQDVDHCTDPQNGTFTRCETTAATNP